MTTHHTSPLPKDLLVEELRLAAMSVFTAQRGFALHGDTVLADRLLALLDDVRAVISEADQAETRNFDGSPGTPAQQRFFALRGSGYTGPIDQDGHPVTDGPVVDILTALAGIPATREVSP
jgi:hypothetical protein